MNPKKRKFFRRALTGVVYAVAVTGCTLWGPLTFGLLFTLISALTVHELGALIKHNGKAEPNQLLPAVAAACLFLATMGCCTRPSGGQHLFLPYIALLICLLIAELYLKKADPISNWACTMLSQVYVALPFALLNVLAYHPTPQGTIAYNPILPLSVFVILWLNDSGAYCVGVLLGRHRLFPRISPKKSWEGSIGGGIIALIGSLVFARYFHFLSPGKWLGLAVVVVVFGAWGDLVESLFKRQLGLKDSGHVLPGHGGWLDRMDSMLLAVPAAVGYLWLVH